MQNKNQQCAGKYCPNCTTRHCKNGMEDCRFATDYRPNCEINEQLFQRYNIPVTNGSHFRIFLQKHGNQILKDEQKQFVERTKQENPSGCDCVYQPLDANNAHDANNAPNTNALNVHDVKSMLMSPVAINPINPRQILDNRANRQTKQNIQRGVCHNNTSKLFYRSNLGNYPFASAQFECGLH